MGGHLATRTGAAESDKEPVEGQLALTAASKQQAQAYLLQALLAEGAMWGVIQTALQTALTEGMAAGCCHRLIEQSVERKEKDPKPSTW